MIFRTIFLPFCLWLLISLFTGFTLFPQVYAEVVTTPGGIEVDLPANVEQHDAIFRHIRELDRQLVRFFRGSRTSRSLVCRIEVVPEQLELCRVLPAKSGGYLQLSADYDEWKLHPLTNQMLLSAMIISRLGGNVENSWGRFPAWIADGILRKMRKTPTRQLVNLTYYPGIRSLLIAGGTVDFLTEISNTNSLAARKAGGAFYELHAETSEFMLNEFYHNGSASDNLLADYVILLIQNTPPADALGSTLGRALKENSAYRAIDQAEPFLSSREKLLKTLNTNAYNRVFNRFDPLPADEIAKRFQQFRNVVYTRENQKGEMETVSIDFIALPEAARADVEARSVAAEKRLFIRDLSRMVDDQFRLIFVKLEDALGRITATPPDQLKGELYQICEEINATLTLQQQREQYLNQLEMEAVPPAHSFAEERNSVSANPDILSRKLKQFLEQTEEHFLAE